jgi:proton glutamate symport protein
MRSKICFYEEKYLVSPLMKKNLLKLHNQILIALILGAIAGSVFNVSKSSLVISTKIKNTILKQTVKDWQEAVFICGDTSIFSSSQQTEIVNKSKQLIYLKKSFALYFKNVVFEDIKQKELSFVDPVSVLREKSFLLSIKWIGDIFIRLLNMVAIPLVLASLTVGAASLGDIKKFARIGSKTLTYFLSTTAFAVVLGLVLANIIRPGERMNPETKQRLLSSYNQDAASKVVIADEFSFSNEIVKIVPKNPINALAGSEMIQIVFFALLLGLTLSLVDKEKAAPVLNFFDGLSETMIKMVNIIMYIAPLGVFALISAVVSEFGFDILQTLFWYAFTVLLGLILHTYGIYSTYIKIFSKMQPGTFFKGIKRVQTIAFSTSSSAATLPVNMECCQDNFGVSKSITSFVLPLGATVNMDGTALYQGVAAVFIAQVFGMDLTIAQQLTIVLTATLASIGTAPVPGVGIIMLIIILKSVNIPEEGIAMILGIDRILDMCRTVTNVSGDATGAVIIASSEGELLAN